MRARSQSSQRSQYRPTGTPRRGGFHKLCAYIAMRVRGTRTPVTATTAGCSFLPLRTVVLAADQTGAPILIAQENSSGVRGSCIGVTAIVGTNGVRLALADYCEAWEAALR